MVYKIAIPQMKLRVVIAETETLFSDFLGEHLERALGSVEVTTLRTVEELRAVGAERYDLALADLFLTDGPALPWLSSQMAERPSSRIIVITGTTADYQVHQVMRCGVPGVVHKTDGLASFRMALSTVVAGGAYCSPRIHTLRTAFAADPLFYAKILSPREQEVLLGLANGGSTEELARCLGVSTATCIDHRKTIMRKLGLHRQSELVAYALRRGFGRAS